MDNLTPENTTTDVPVTAMLTSRANTSFNGGLFIIAFFVTLYLTQEIVIPMVMAFMLKLVLQPAIRFLEHLRLPRGLVAVIIVFSLVGGFLGIGTFLYQPAVDWAQKIPEGLPKMQERLTFLSRPIKTTQAFIAHAETVTQSASAKVLPVAIEGNRLSDRILHSTGAVVSGVFTMLLLLMFLIVSGDTFLRKLVEVLPRFQDKRQAVDISNQIERDISAYLLTITFMNLLVGVCDGVHHVLL